MSRASTEQEVMRRKMVDAVSKMSPDDVRAMVLASLKLAGTYEMHEMANATSFADFDTMDLKLDLTA